MGIKPNLLALERSPEVTRRKQTRQQTSKVFCGQHHLPGCTDPKILIAADLDNAVEKFKNISDRLGGADKAKVFFDLYGPQDLAPAKTEDRKSDDSDKASDRAKELAKEHKLDTTIQVQICLRQS